ncbi:hypothetical protein ACTG0T_02780 [Halococcus morrhuae DSM 1307]|nr:hypothetical protein [Halococcus morrhuae]
MSVEIKGFEELAGKLDRLAENADSIDGENTVSFDELFTPEFMQTYTEYDSIESFFGQSRWTVETQDDFKHIPEDDFDRYVDDHTGFNSWEAMLSAAAREWTTRQLSA